MKSTGVPRGSTTGGAGRGFERLPWVPSGRRLARPPTGGYPLGRNPATPPARGGDMDGRLSVPGPAAPQGTSEALERLGVLDVLRGIALLGMYVVHFHNYSAARPGADENAPFEKALGTIVSLFFDARFYTMFGMLFGAGFAIQLARADARGEAFVARYLRRLFLLA